ncbi:MULTISPECIES: BamA/TamA family outer membrane protein [unclassified Carboxylicivirga]|uniref:BamA/TamA family outer membrane protein n=1 Tax=Carboxylicivirga TaxID=1628153 RepID=UPI003D340F4F
MKQLTAFLICVLLYGNLVSISAQKDSLRLARKEQRNARFSILGGPGYSPETGLLIGGSMLATFDINRLDTLKPRSVVPLAFGIILSNGGGITLSSRPQLFFNADRLRITGQLSYRQSPDHYYGVGYQNALHTIRSDSTTAFDGILFQFNPVILLKLGHSRFYLGPMIDFVHEQINKPSKGIVDDPYYARYGGTETGYVMTTNSIGFSLSYDTRDVPANAYKGIFLDVKVTYADNWLGSDVQFGTYALEYRQYQSIRPFGPRRILAWNISSKYSFGDVPPTRMQRIGTPFDLRGYYSGQFRDAAGNVFVAEYRHMFNTGSGKIGRLWKHIGFAGWAGAGFMGSSPFDIEGVLPNAGLGLRIELQPRMNFRLDVGRGFKSNQTLIYFNMTEAF